jgi:hypothetical protein
MLSARRTLYYSCLFTWKLGYILCPRTPMHSRTHLLTTPTLHTGINSKSSEVCLCITLQITLSLRWHFLYVPNAIIERLTHELLVRFKWLSSMPYRCMGGGEYSTTICDLCTRWERVVSFTSQFLHSWYTLAIELLRRSGCCREDGHFSNIFVLRNFCFKNLVFGWIFLLKLSLLNEGTSFTYKICYSFTKSPSMSESLKKIALEQKICRLILRSLMEFLLLPSVLAVFIRVAIHTERVFKSVRNNAHHYRNMTRPQRRPRHTIAALHGFTCSTATYSS